MGDCGVNVRETSGLQLEKGVPSEWTWPHRLYGLESLSFGETGGEAVWTRWELTGKGASFISPSGGLEKDVSQQGQNTDSVKPEPESSPLVAGAGFSGNPGFPPPSLPAFPVLLPLPHMDCIFLCLYSLALFLLSTVLELPVPLLYADYLHLFSTSVNLICSFFFFFFLGFVLLLLQFFFSLNSCF